MNLPVRRALAAAAATAALVAIAGCGGVEPDGNAAEKRAPSTSAATAADEPAPSEGSEQGDSGDETGDDAGGGEAMTGDEFADLLRTALDQATTAHLTMDLGGLGTGEGEADYTTTPPDMAVKMSMDALGGDVEVRMVDGTIYLKGATFGDTWVSVATDDPSSPLGDLGSQLDPTKQFEAFADAVTEATYDGAVELDGETLDHYTATVDTAELLQQLPDAAVGQSGLPDSLTQEWWFDDEGRIRRFSSDFGGMAGGVSLSLSEWGEDVTIEAPPADQVTPMGQAGV